MRSNLSRTESFTVATSTSRSAESARERRGRSALVLELVRRGPSDSVARASAQASRAFESVFRWPRARGRRHRQQSAAANSARARRSGRAASRGRRASPRRSAGKTAVGPCASASRRARQSPAAGRIARTPESPRSASSTGAFTRLPRHHSEKKSRECRISSIPRATSTSPSTRIASASGSSRPARRLDGVGDERPEKPPRDVSRRGGLGTSDPHDIVRRPRGRSGPGGSWIPRRARPRRKESRPGWT